MKIKTVLDTSMNARLPRNLKVGRVIFMRHYFSKSVSLAPIPYLMSILGLQRTFVREFTNLAIIGVGVVMLSALAQVQFPLPWTPVPVTGQTFGVLLMGLLMGRTRAFVTVLAYLACGVFGFSVFAVAKAGLVLGPTSGYLAGMLLSSFVVGWLSDLGWCNRFSTCIAAGLVSSVIVFSSGLFVLSYFIPNETLLSAGLIPFIPGDIIKITLAALLVAPVSHGIRRI